MSALRTEPNIEIQELNKPAQAADAHPLTNGLILLLATSTGLAVASLYYSQPILGVIASRLNVGEATVGLVPTLTQLGYALGILLLAPLGDRYDRKHIILAKASVLTLALLCAGLAPGIAALLAASLLIGLSATLAQDVVPAAAMLAPPAIRGKTVGKVMTGLLLGILLSRVVSGLVAEQLGWRVMFLCAAASIALIAVVVHRRLPNFQPTTSMPYRALLGSLATLWRQHPALRRAALAQGLLSVGFSAFWSTLAVMLHNPPYHLGSAAAGLFGLAGAAGALAAPVAGRFADRHGPERVTRLGAILAAVSFAAMFALPWLPPMARLGLIALGAVGFDMGVQVALIAHQTIVFGIEPEARSRLNSILVVTMFIGMATGAGLGSQALAHWGWPAVLLLSMIASLAALVLRLAPSRTA